MRRTAYLLAAAGLTLGGSWLLGGITSFNQGDLYPILEEQRVTYTLGHGFDPSNPKGSRPSPFASLTTKPSPVDEVTILNIRQITSAEELIRESAAAARIEARYMFASGTLSASFRNLLESNTSSLSWEMNFFRRAPKYMIADWKLSGEAKAMPKDEFVSVFGPEVVTEVQRSCSLVATFRLKRSERTSVEQSLVQFAGKANGQVWGVDSKASFQSMMKEISISSDAEATLTAKYHDLESPPSTPFKLTSETDVENFLKTVDTYLQKMSDEHAVPDAFVTTSADILKPGPSLPSSSDSELLDAFGETLELQRLCQAINLVVDRRFDKFAWVHEEKISDLEKQLPECKSLEREWRAFGKAVLSDKSNARRPARTHDDLNIRLPSFAIQLSTRPHADPEWKEDYKWGDSTIPFRLEVYGAVVGKVTATLRRKDGTQEQVHIDNGVPVQTPAKFSLVGQLGKGHEFWKEESEPVFRIFDPAGQLLAVRTLQVK